ncbi:MAG: CCC motif membrane protein [Chitinophagaceae bacterium]
MENLQQPFNYQPFQRALPNAQVVLILGILSIPGCFCYGLLGIIFAIVAIVLASKDNRIYRLNPTEFTEASYKQLKTGKICAIIGLILSAMLFLMIVGILAFVGMEALKNPDILMNKA